MIRSTLALAFLILTAPYFPVLAAAWLGLGKVAATAFATAYLWGLVYCVAADYNRWRRRRWGK
jgi:hypothetical protein